MRNYMTSIARRLSLGVAFLTMGGFVLGCGGAVRSVTHISTWSGGAKEYLYIGYAENKDVSKVRRCLINDDNSLKCNEEDGLTALLNADD